MRILGVVGMLVLVPLSAAPAGRPRAQPRGDERPAGVAERAVLPQRGARLSGVLER